VSAISTLPIYSQFLNRKDPTTIIRNRRDH
jgi:hypothetical protein